MQAATYYTQSLSTLEANAESDGILMNSFKLSTESTTKVNDFLEQRLIFAFKRNHNYQKVYKLVLTDS